ncbi:MAG: DUF4440 domain-containing protein [Granulicella sp.]
MDQAAILNDLIPREPIFHTPLTADPTRLMAPTYWEIGASGRIYTRAIILEHLAQNPPIDAATANWRTTNHALFQLSPDTYLLTYTLQQEARLTRRATLWQQTPTGWQILYHQGTLVVAD